jgi:hypothetical protein
VQRNQLILNKRITNELRLIDLLNQYGAKFSTLNVLIYDVGLLYDMLKQHAELVYLPSTLFHPHDHVSFNDITIQPDSIVPIEIYLKCLLHVLKLHLPTLYLKSGVEVSPLNSRTRIAMNRDTGESFCGDIANFCPAVGEPPVQETPNTQANQAKFYDFKVAIEVCLKQLVDFVAANVIDSFERDFYFGDIREALEHLSKYYQ